MLVVDNNRKRNTAKQSEVHLKSIAHIMKDNFIKLALKDPVDDSSSIRPALSQLLPINFTPIPHDKELQSRYCQFIIMLFESTLIPNKLDAKQNSRTTRINVRRGGENRDNANNPIIVKKNTTSEEVNYIIANIKGNADTDRIDGNSGYTEILTILSSVDLLLFQTTSRAINNVAALYRFTYKDSSLNINDAMEYIIEDEYARAVFCELVGTEKFMFNGQTTHYHTKIQTFMSVVLNEQHTNFLAAFLNEKINRQ
jgi:hypothetical protein